MAVACVRVPRGEGEATRLALADAGVLSTEYAIDVDGEMMYLPLANDADHETLAETYDVVSRDVPERDTQTLPQDLLGFEPSYERLGEIAIIDEDDTERAHEIAEALAASDLPIATVVNRASPIEGERRLREWDVLVGESTETVHREYGCAFELDIARVYFSPRLATERRRVITQVHSDEHVFDMFAGVGPFVIPAAARGAAAVGVDVNPAAIEYLRQNAASNDVADRVTAINDDVRTVSGYEGWADRVIMNLPHSADDFIETAVALAGDACHLHYYDIQHEDDPFSPGETAIRTAASPEYKVAIETRQHVRSYAPHEINICLDAHLTR